MWARFPRLVARLHDMVDRFLTTLDCVDHAFVADETLEQLPAPAYLGQTRVKGIDLNKPRMRAVLAAVLALVPAPTSFTLNDVATQVQALLGPTAPAYQPQHAAYDLKKLRAKGLIGKVESSRRYQAPPEGLRTIAALVILRDKVISRFWPAQPNLRWAASRRPGAPSMSITKRSAKTCRPCSRTWVSPHRQLFVDVAMTSA